VEGEAEERGDYEPAEGVEEIEAETGGVLSSATPTPIRMGV
jgi:hypothetical protein